MAKKFRVAELARERNMNQEDLSRASGVRLHTVQRIWQNKIERPYADTLIALARALGVSIEALYNDADSGYTNEHTIIPGLAAAPSPG